MLLADEHHVDQGQLANTLLAYDGHAPAACSRLQPSELTAEHVHNRFSEPVIVDASPSAAHQLGMVLPPAESSTVQELVKALGYEKEVRPGLGMQ